MPIISIGAALIALVLAAHVPEAAAEQARTLFERESEYNHVIVQQEGNERILHFRRRSVDYRETVVDTRQPLRLIAEWTRLMMAGLMFVQQPRRVLMIGLGGGLVTRVMAHHYPDCTFDNVELDPAVVEAAQRFFYFTPGQRMRVHVRDGRIFLRQSRDRYDIIILDAYRGGYIPFHLKTREFLELVRNHLAPGGVVISNLHHGTRLYDADRVTYAAVFSQSYAFVGREDSNVILVSHVGTSRLTREQLEQTAARLQRERQFGFDLPALMRHYQERPDYDRSARVLTDDHAPVESLNENGR
jgi:spermidine synthase